MNENVTVQEKTENMTLNNDNLKSNNVDKNDNNAQQCATADTENSDLEREIIDCLINSDAIFKSQQKSDPELSLEEKRKIALNTLKKSQCLFLSKFGQYLKKEHLKFFDKNDYEVSYHLNRLQRYFNNTTRHRDIRNRRYEALKMLVEKGEYFSECEMMKRNPLLYEQLVGQYMTEDQKKARDCADAEGSTFVNIIIESIDRDRVKQCQKEQQEEENNAFEESDSDDTEESFPTLQKLSKDDRVMWGEKLENLNQETSKEEHKKVKHEISNGEKHVLRQEFVTNMYQSFLDGKDTDFDYSTVDDNDAYDNIDLRTQDEEERYFDSESPETVTPEQNSQNLQNDESEDELDAYMRSLKDGNSTNTFSMDKDT